MPVTRPWSPKTMPAPVPLSIVSPPAPPATMSSPPAVVMVSTPPYSKAML
jgi:hypothetical protein